MTSRFCLNLSEPAKGFTESFLLGNGRLGASVLGRPGTESFALNLDTLWSGGPMGDEPGASPAYLLQSLRAAIKAGDFQRADALSRDMQGPGWTQSYQPLGTLKLNYAGAQDIKDYGRSLDMGKAETRVRYATKDGPVDIRTLISAPADVLVATIAGSGALSFTDMVLQFESPHQGVAITSAEIGVTKWLTIAGRVPANVLPNYIEQEPAITYGQDAPDADGTVAAGMGYAVVAALQADNNGEVRLVLAAESGFRGFDQRPSADLAAMVAIASRKVAAALDQSSQALVGSHRADYAAYFERMDFDLSGSPVHSGLDPQRAELLYHYGRYLMISGSRPGTQPTNLQGIWNVDIRPAWSSNYTVNINTEMNYWPAQMTGLGDLAAPFYDFVVAAAGGRGQAAARHYYGLRGACVHHNTDIWHFSAPVMGDPNWANWASGLIWLAFEINGHLEYHPDDAAFVSGVALPVWRQAVPFALDLLVVDEHGMMIASPSTSPENEFHDADGNPASVSAGSAMDQEMIRALFEMFIAFASPEDAALAQEASAALEKLKTPVLTADGVLAEWQADLEPAEVGHRHLSHLFGLHPGRRITHEQTPEAFAGVRRALDIRLAYGSGATGWSQAWILCQAARLRDQALADKAIHGLLNDLAFKSLMVLHPHSGWAEGNVFQIDGNFGAVAGMTELVVQSRQGRVMVLPTLPASWPNGAVRGIRIVGGHIVDLAWTDGVLTHLILYAGRDESLVLELSAEAPSEIKDRFALAAVKESAAGLPCYRFDVRRGEDYAFAWPSD